MKTLFVLLTTFSIVSASANIDFSFLPSGNVVFPDFSSWEEDERVFNEKIETISQSSEVKAFLSNFEESAETTCELSDKNWAGLKWFRVNFDCFGGQDYRVQVKARIRKGQVLVKGFKVKNK